MVGNCRVYLNNKIHTATKSSLFKVNYRQELRMGFKIERKEKIIGRNKKICR